jgi:uncharacterized protein
MLYKKYIDKLKEILTKNNVCDSHGIGHALKVYSHAVNALTQYVTLYDEERMAIVLAALLHDADDKKFFPTHNNYENLRLILDDIPDKTINLIIKMIDLVSASKNGDNIPDDIKGKEWMLIPRYADRLEAIGIIGIERCWKYTKTINNPLYLESTLRAIDENDLWTNIATEERYQKYNGKSASMIDHFYDKLLRLTIFPIRNKYFDTICAIRRKPLVDFVLEFGKLGSIDDKFIESFINKE